MVDSRYHKEVPSVVHCDAHNCAYNDEIKKCCCAPDISVCNETACRPSETYCSSFKMKR